MLLSTTSPATSYTFIPFKWVVAVVVPASIPIDPCSCYVYKPDCVSTLLRGYMICGDVIFAFIYYIKEVAGLLNKVLGKLFSEEKDWRLTLYAMNMRTLHIKNEETKAIIAMYVGIVLESC